MWINTYRYIHPIKLQFNNVNSFENWSPLFYLLLSPYLCYISFLYLNVDVLWMPTGQGKVREIWFLFKARENSGKSVKWSGKLENLQKSGEKQGILKSCLVHPTKIEPIDTRWWLIVSGWILLAIQLSYYIFLFASYLNLRPNFWSKVQVRCWWSFIIDCLNFQKRI